MSGELSGRKAIVTGGASGIGASIALSLAAAGAEVVIADINKPEATVNRALEAGSQVRGVACDVSDDKQVSALFRSIEETEGSLDFAINAAGILVEARLVEMPVAQFQQVIDVHLKGSFLIAQGAARMMTGKSGRIILISSELAYLGREDYSAYCASKAGVVGLTRSLARELAPNILVNSIAPGPVDTPMLGVENMSKEWIDKEFNVPLGRIGRPGEIAALARFLCGPDAGFFTGQTLSPNGGAVML